MQGAIGSPYLNAPVVAGAGLMPPCALFGYSLRRYRPPRSGRRRANWACLTLAGCRCLSRPFWARGRPMAVAFVFPGQGSQAVGMGLALANAFPIARRTFEEVDEALSDKLSRIMWEGPAE